MQASAKSLHELPPGIEHGLPPRGMLIQRYRAILGFLETDQRIPAEYAWLCFAAHHVVLCPDDPDDLAQRIFSLAGELKQQSGWSRELASPTRFVIAALLVQQNLTVTDFLIQHLQTIGLLRNAGLRSYGFHETMAAVIINMSSRTKSFDMGDAIRIRSLYGLMKKRHWWLTGVGALPDCAALAFCHQTPDDTIAFAADAYERLRSTGLHRGRHLQSAVHILPLGEIPVDEALERWIALKEALEVFLGPLSPERFEAISILALLGKPPELVIRALLTICNELDFLQPRMSRTANFYIATNLTVLDMMRFDGKREPLRDANGIDGMLRTLHCYHIASAVVLSHLKVEMVSEEHTFTFGV